MRRHRTPGRRLPRAATLIVACLLLLAAAPATQAAPSIERGDRGATVKRLQRALHMTPDGIFGKGTEQVLRRFQRRHGLKPDGVAGPATWRALRRSGRRSRSRSGAARPRQSVRLLQRRLGVGADGVFGPGTQRAVRRFQRRHGLTPDGVVGPATWRALQIGGDRPVLKRVRLRQGTRTTGGGLPIVVARAIAAANRIAHKPYRYGGGHGSFRDSGYDCSGSLSYVLNGAGLLRRPLHSTPFMRYGAAGRGRWITIYANPGHAYMTIRTRRGVLRFDTSGMDDGSRWDGEMRSAAGYVVRHPVGY